MPFEFDPVGRKRMRMTQKMMTKRTMMTTMTKMKPEFGEDNGKLNDS